MEPKRASDKGQLIEAIRQHNPTADADYLDRFDVQSLRDYLRRLQPVAERGVRMGRRGAAAPKRRLAS